jgi:WD40 repeat protein
MASAEPSPQTDTEDQNARKLWAAICPQLYDYIRENTGLDGVPGGLAWLPELPSSASADSPACKHQLQFLLNPPTVAKDVQSGSDPSNLFTVTTMLPRASTDVDASQGIFQREYGNLRPDWMLVASQIHPTAKTPILTKALRHPFLDRPLWACSFLFDADVIVMSPQQPASTSASSSSSSSSAAASSPKSATSFAELEVNPFASVRLCGHSRDTSVTGLSWNSKEPTQLLSAGHDGKVMLWSVEGTAVVRLSAWNGPIPWHVVEWNTSSAFQFAAGGEHHFSVWDTRLDAEKDGPTHQHDLEDSRGASPAVMTLAFNPSASSTLLATGGRDHPVTVWDLRSLRAPLCSFADAHVLDASAASLDRCGASHELVTHVAWCPHDDTILGSSGAPNRVCVFDMARARTFAEDGIAAGASEEEEEDDEDEAAAGDGTGEPATKSNLAHHPGRVFTHEGHQSVVTDFAWNPHEDWTIASCERRGPLQIWQISSDIAYGEEVDGDGEEEDGDDDEQTITDDAEEDDA